MKIEKTNSTPEIIFDKDHCELSFKGASYPENANHFYEPIKTNIHNCFNDLNGKEKDVKIICKFTLLNSVSTRYMYEFFKISDLYSQHNKPVVVDWFYESDDEDMGGDGKIFKKSFKYLNFNIIGVDDIDNITVS